MSQYLVVCSKITDWRLTCNTFTQTHRLQSWCGMLEPTCTRIWTGDACWTFRHFVGFFVKHSCYYSLNNLYWKTVEVNTQRSSLSSYFPHVSSLCCQCSWRSYLRCLLTKSHDVTGWYMMYDAEVQRPWWGCGDLWMAIFGESFANFIFFFNF